MQKLENKFLRWLRRAERTLAYVQSVLFHWTPNRGITSWMPETWWLQEKYRNGTKKLQRRKVTSKE